MFPPEERWTVDLLSFSLPTSKYLGGAPAGARSLEISEVRRAPPQQLASWKSAYTKRLDALGFFKSSEAGGYAYPTELVPKHVEPSSSEKDGVALWDPDPDREEDGCRDVEDDEVDDPGEAENDTAEPVVLAAPQELERWVLLLLIRKDMKDGIC